MRTSTDCGGVRCANFFGLTKVGPVSSMLLMGHGSFWVSSRLRQFSRVRRKNFEVQIFHFAPLPHLLANRRSNEIRQDLLTPRALTLSLSKARTASHLYICPRLVLCFLCCTQALKEPTMEWTAPKHEEIDLNCEISSYANAEL